MTSLPKTFLFYFSSSIFNIPIIFKVNVLYLISFSYLILYHICISYLLLKVFIYIYIHFNSCMMLKMILYNSFFSPLLDLEVASDFLVICNLICIPRVSPIL